MLDLILHQIIGKFNYWIFFPTLMDNIKENLEKYSQI